MQLLTVPLLPVGLGSMILDSAACCVRLGLSTLSFVTAGHTFST